MFDNFKFAELQRRRDTEFVTEVPAVAPQNDLAVFIPRLEEIGAATDDRPVAFVVGIELFAVKFAVGTIVFPRQREQSERTIQRTVIRPFPPEIS